MLNVLFFKQMIRYGLVGVVATATNAFIFISLVDWLNIFPLLANAVACLFAVCISYYGNACWTFKRDHRDKKSMMRFFSVALVGFVSNSYIVWVTMHIWQQSAYIATVGMILITPFVVFLLSKYWVFKEI